MQWLWTILMIGIYFDNTLKRMLPSTMVIILWRRLLITSTPSWRMEAAWWLPGVRLVLVGGRQERDSSSVLHSPLLVVWWTLLVLGTLSMLQLLGAWLVGWGSGGVYTLGVRYRGRTSSSYFIFTVFCFRWLGEKLGSEGSKVLVEMLEIYYRRN